MPPREVRAAVWRRCAGLCERCGRVLAGGAYSWWLRVETGPDAASNLLVVCGDVRRHSGCVSDLLDHLVYAAALGWVVRAGRDLTRVPVQVKWRGFVLLDDAGSYHPVAV